MTYARRVDGNHASMKGHFERLGCAVHDASRAGGGFPDLVVSLHKQTVLVEIKDPTKPKADQQLTPDQVKFHREWKGVIYEARTLDDVIAIVGEMKRVMKMFQ